MKCRNCGGMDFAKFGNHFECVCCGFPVSNIEERAEPDDINNYNELESLLNNLTDLLKEPRLDEKTLLNISESIVKLDSNNILASFFIKYLGRGDYPENYKNYIYQLEYKTIDDINESIIVPFMIANSEYKYFDTITNMLISKGLYQKYSNMIYVAKKKIEEEDENYSDIARDVFVCYSSNDLDTVNDIVRKIEADGNTCWYANRNMPKNSLSQTDYKTKIENAISKCSVFLVVMSENSMLSDDVKWELDVANKYNKQNRIEYRIQDVENTTKFKLFFDGIQWIDAINDGQESLLLGRIYDFMHPTIPTDNDDEDEINPVSCEERDICDDETVEEDDAFDDETVEEDDEIELISSEKDNTIEIISESIDEVVDSKTISLPVSNQEFDDDSEEDNGEDESIEEDYDNEDENSLDIEERKDYKETDSADLNRQLLSMFENKEYENAINILDQYEELPDDLENLVYYYIGYCFETGSGIEKDSERVAYFYNLAKNNNPVGSEKNLGLCFFNLGLRLFKEEYNHIVKKSASNGDTSKEGYKLLMKAANYGNAESMAYIGLCHKYGLYVPRNGNEAIQWFIKSSNRDCGLGAYHLGKCYADGFAVQKDEKEAFNQYLKASKLGNDLAMVAVGVCYYYGRGIFQSYEMAFKYDEVASGLGNVTAIYNLAQCYYNGKGVAKDEQKAFELFAKAASLGNKAAIDFLNGK